MINDLKLTPITGTFINLFLGDTGINNYGLEEWETDFQLMQAIGIDTLIVLRGETESGGRYLSALDPRSTTWAEDPNLLSMFFRLCEKYDIKLYLGEPKAPLIFIWVNGVRKFMRTRRFMLRCWKNSGITPVSMDYTFRLKHYHGILTSLMF